MASTIQADPVDHVDHEGFFIQVGRETGVLMGAFLWKTHRGQGCGGVRLWEYDSLQAYIRDGMRLSLGMGRKNALAGLWWGGGKGVIARPPGNRHTDPGFRKAVFEEYGEFVTSLRGCYVGAEDVGITVEDVNSMFSRTRFMTCISPSLGGSGNPSITTAEGVVCAMESALSHLAMGDLRGKKVVMQGAGNVADHMTEDLLQRDVGSVVIADIIPQRVETMRRKYKLASNVQVLLVDPSDESILAEPCDILAPNALGGSINARTIPTIKARIICGAANNQLRDPRTDDKLLKAKSILFVPDFVCNRMGIVNCANEQYGYCPDDEAIQRHFGRTWSNSVFNITSQVLRLAEEDQCTTTEAANRLADQLANEQHPIWPNRAQDIVSGLIRDQWHTQLD
eukprot:GILJ01006864.1.p1 GENE.GILJ01006864.1~~GILJ01006864.1.p1  ORF type:complete len:396 (+),score=51.31 GILJ01006864.1:337-1524(+)